ncbi:hypothetical protein B0J18DRAFT_400007 [Chaetomium sp. MPI-SDFR-AT-0129]|nr:hypothetical protein B0J18DRAFT_400007 [Chaetomium sp. MPI-SDFR-AT-0129]
MAMRGGPRLQVGSAAWVAEERDSALTIAKSELEEFSFSARNEVDWLNEHMAEIFSESQMNVTELFKTPGKLRGKTPRTIRKTAPNAVRMPLTSMFSATPKGAPSPFTIPISQQPQNAKMQLAEDKPDQSNQSDTHPESPSKHAVVRPPHSVENHAPISLGDSGYHGSQSQDTVPFDHFDKDVEMSDSPEPEPLDDKDQPGSPLDAQQPQETAEDTLPEHAALTPSSAILQPSSPFPSRTRLPIMSPRSPSPNKISSPARQATNLSSSPQKPLSPQKTSSLPETRDASPQKEDEMDVDANGENHENDDDEEMDEPQSPSEASSPIRPLVRKSSLNFASLPAREPLASKKSLGGSRLSRTSHLDFNRQSYYNRPTGGKSLGGAMRRESLEDDDNDEMDVDDDVTTQNEDTAVHSKTYTQRLQDQISMLGKGQSAGTRTSKSVAHLLPSQQASQTAQSQAQPEPTAGARKPSPEVKQSAPGAFPEDEDDDWITSPRAKTAPSHLRSLSDDRDQLPSRGGLGTSDAVIPTSRQGSPAKTSEWTPKHSKSASVPVLPTMEQLDSDMDGSPLKKTISVSNPALATVDEDEFASSPPKSPTRTFRDSPLKQVKNKLTSLLKGGKGFMASSAAVSADTKAIPQSPSSNKLGYHQETSVESFKTADNVVYPDLSQQVAATAAPLSPTRSNSSRRTRASAEKERLEAKEREREEKEKEKEAREAKRMADQMDKLDKAREQEREKARVFSKEQERIAAMEKEVAAQQKEQDKQPARSESRTQDFRTPGPALNRPRSPVKMTKATPLKSRGLSEQGGKRKGVPSDDMDADMTDVTTTTTVPPPSIPRPTTASSMRAQKRPTKPTKETLAKAKQGPTLIRVNPLSSQQNQFHPSNSVLAANLQETLGQPQAPSTRPLNGKASQASLQGKGSVQSFKSSVSSTGRPKALEMAAKRKEQEEREAQRKRDTKLELERKRAAQEEERRQEQQRKAEAERQKEEERKAAQKKAAIERAKQTKAPPPAVRSQPNGPPEYNLASAERGTLRPPSRLGSTMHQEGRLVNTVLSSTTGTAGNNNTNKGSVKRPLQQDGGEESSRSQSQQKQRAMPSFQAKEAKRMRMSEEFDEDLDTMDSHNPRIIKGPPVRPSAGFKKDLTQKSLYAANGNYPHAPPPSASKDLFKTAVTAQHTSHASKPGHHALDTAQFSKGAIPFAQNPHKTPARPIGGIIPKSSAAKSIARSSPRPQNGEGIELPDIQTDDESDDDDDGYGGGGAGTTGKGLAPEWTDSPALREALLRQERLDPMSVFGPPAPLIMEEVFSKTKDRFHKFRARTSSANWSGTDRLTEEEVRRDNAARDKMRREGGWSYELGRDMS